MSLTVSLRMRARLDKVKTWKWVAVFQENWGTSGRWSIECMCWIRCFVASAKQWCSARRFQGCNRYYAGKVHIYEPSIYKQFLRSLVFMKKYWTVYEVADYVFLNAHYFDGPDFEAPTWATQSTNEEISYLPMSSTSCLWELGQKVQFGYYLRYDLGWSCVQPGFLSTLDSKTSNVLCQKSPVQPVGEFL